MVNESFAYSVSDAIGLCGLMIFFFPERPVEDKDRKK